MTSHAKHHHPRRPGGARKSPTHGHAHRCATLAAARIAEIPGCHQDPPENGWRQSHFGITTSAPIDISVTHRGGAVSAIGVFGNDATGDLFYFGVSDAPGSVVVHGLV